jgi:hypothetical protein
VWLRRFWYLCACIRFSRKQGPEKCDHSNRHVSTSIRSPRPTLKILQSSYSPDEVQSALNRFEASIVFECSLPSIESRVGTEHLGQRSTVALKVRQAFFVCRPTPWNEVGHHRVVGSAPVLVSLGLLRTSSLPNPWIATLMQDRDHFNHFIACEKIHRIGKSVK